MDEDLTGLDPLLNGFDFSPSVLIGGFIFGVIGFYLFRAGRKRVDYRVMGIGVALMTYPLFVSSAWLLWGIGVFLSVLAYHFLEGG